VWLELGTHVGQGAADPGFDGAQGAIEGGGDFGVGHAGGVTEVEDQAFVGGKAGEGLADEGGEFNGLGLGGVRACGIEGDGVAGGAGGSGAEVIEGAVAGDGDDPGFESAAGRVEGRGAVPDAEEGFLGEVLGNGVVEDQAEDDVVREAAVGVVDRGEGARVAGFEAIDEAGGFLFGFGNARHVVSPLRLMRREGHEGAHGAKIIWKRKYCRAGTAAKDRRRRSAGERAKDPGLGENPVALDGGGGDADDFGAFLDGEATEEAEFDDAGLLRVDLGEAGEGVVEGDQLDVAFGGDGEGFIEGEGRHGTAAFEGRAGAGVIDQDVANDGGSDAEEVGAGLPVGAVLIDQAEVGLVDEGGGLKGGVGLVAAGEAGGDEAEFAIDQGHEAIEGRTVATAPLGEQLSYIAAIFVGGFGHGPGQARPR